MSPTLHIIGAGLSGLAAALTASANGIRTVIYDAAPHPGGRCRSFADKRLGCTIDNGNHLILGKNHHALDYLREIGTLDSCLTREPATFQFVDIRSRKLWNLQPPRKFPGIPWYDWPRLIRLYNPAQHKTITQCLSPKSALHERLIEPLTLAALNTGTEEASAALLSGLFRMLLQEGESAWRYYVPKESLSASFILPAVARIRQNGGTFYFQNPVQGVEKEGERITALRFSTGAQPVQVEDIVICAASAPAFESLLPELAPGFSYSAILNGHFKWPYAGNMRETLPFFGVIGGVVQWLFLQQGRLSTTTSAANGLMDKDEETLARLLWEDTRKALFMPDAKMPEYRIIKEKRATIAATPENLAKRPQLQTPYSNLLLAGDFLQSPYPATIEAAISNGRAASEHALRHLLAL